MFRTEELRQYNLIDGGKTIGKVYFNPDFSFQSKTTRPFIRSGSRMVEFVGRVNYQMLDQFIISSLNDYYSKLSLAKNEEEKFKKTTEYQQLYYLWQKVASAKQSQDVNLNNYYDDIVYRLYLLGYRN